MFVRIGLVITAIVLVALLFLGVGAGLGYVQIGSDGISFGKVNDSADGPSDSKIVSADELLRRKGLNVDQPSPQPVVEAPKPPVTTAPSPAIVHAPAIVPEPVKPVIVDKPRVPEVATGRPDAGAKVKDRSDVAESRDDIRREANAREIALREAKMRDAAQRENDNRDNVKRKIVAPEVAGDREGAKQAGPEWVVRVAAGYDKPITDPAGNVWEAASGFEGGEVADRGDINIENSRFPALYRMERWKMVSWKRKIPTGHYIVLLHFAETWTEINGPGQRVFGVEVQGKPTGTIDVFKESGGPRRELIKILSVNVPDNKMALRFIKTGKNFPTLCGIEVIPIASGRKMNKEDLRRQVAGFRVAAGSLGPICEPNGILWLSDLGFEGGQVVDRGVIGVEDSRFPDLYRNEHFGMSAWHTDMPNGQYTVNLHFAETWKGITGPGQRVFHVTVQDADLHDLDIFKEVGFRHALVKTFHVTVTHEKLTIQFQNTDKNVAEINGIEVIREK